jgi:hypothetical protein
MLRKVSELDFIASLYSGVHIKTNVCPITIAYLRLRLLGYNIPTTNIASHPDAPNQSTGMGVAKKTFSATLQHLAEGVVLHPTTTILATCSGRVQLSLLTMQHLVLQATRASPGNTRCPPLEYADVFMDNFILLTQGPVEQQQQVHQMLLECLDLVIQPLDQTDHLE